MKEHVGVKRLIRLKGSRLTRGNQLCIVTFDTANNATECRLSY